MTETDEPKPQFWYLSESVVLAALHAPASPAAERRIADEVGRLAFPPKSSVRPRRPLTSPLL